MAAVDILDVARECGIKPDPKTLHRIEVQANCPFCDDRKLHLYLNTNEHKWMCQRCRRGGSASKLYAMMENISEEDAFRRIIENPRISVSSSLTAAQSVKQYDLKPLEERHAVYLDFLELLTLSSFHRADLRRRGLSDEIINGNLYKTVPLNDAQRAGIIRALARRRDLRGVPGFYYDEKRGEWRMAARAGFFIPVCDCQNRIQGLQIRLDDSSDKKYRWFSTSKYPNGCAAKAWVHVTGDLSRVADETLCLIEGALKADVSSFLSGGAPYAAAPGSNALAFLPDTLRTLRPKRILENWDMDKLTNEHVREGAQKVAQIARPYCQSYSSARWDSRYNGRDDYLLAQRKKQIKQAA
jgi:hypothetical protein